MQNKSNIRYKDILVAIRRLYRSAGFIDQCGANYLYGTYEISSDREETKLNLGERGNISTLRDYYEINNPTFVAQLSRFESSIPVSDLNPYKPYPDNEFYVPTQSDCQLDVLLHYTKEPALARNIVVYGNKGSGKTALINHWLYANNDNLERANTFWVRCNAVHIFELWTFKEYVPDRLVTIEEYLDLQLVYVLAKYCLDESRGFLRELFHYLETNNVTFEKIKSIGTPSQVEVTKVTDYLKEQVRREIQQHEKKPRDSLMLSILAPSVHVAHEDEYIRNLVAVGQETRGKERRRWRMCSEAIQRALIQSGIKILWVVDGVDNIHMNHEWSRPLYEKMIKEVRSFIRKKPTSGYLHLTCMRQKTYLDCMNSPLLPYTKEYAKIREIEHKSPAENIIIEKRLAGLFGAARANEATKLLAMVSLENQGWIQKIFHGNIRSYLHNCCTLALTLKYRIEQGVVDVATQIKIQRARNLFLNGRFYLNSRRDWHNIDEEQGIAIFNPFLSLKSELPMSIEDWYGLVRIRLLEVASNKIVEEKTIQEFLVNALGYPSSDVDKALADCLAYEFLEISPYQGRVGYTTTTLGEYVLREMLSNLDALYYFSHDTPVPKLLLDSGYFPSHVNARGTATGYRASAVSSVISFLLVVIPRNYLDKKRMRLHCSSGSEGHNFVFLEKEHLSRLGMAIKRLVHHFEDSDYVVVEECISRINKLIRSESPQLS